MNQPLVSVVMPVYNSAPYLKEAIDSILNQSYSNIELLAINDCSTDSSKDIILSYSDPRVRYFENNPNKGIVKSRNLGIENAKGKYIATLDSDDIALPDRIKTQVCFLEKNPDYGLCGSYYQEINNTGKLLKKKMNYPSSDKDARTFLTIANCFCASAIMVRSDMAKELKYREGYDIVEDYELWYRISKRAKITNLPIYGTYYRVHGNNITITKKGQNIRLATKIYREILADYNIDFTEEELELHVNAIFYNNLFFKDSKKLKQLENWITKFHNELKKCKHLNTPVVHKFFSEKWVVICAKNKNFKQLLFNKLLLQNKETYISVLFNKLTNRAVQY